MIFKIVFSLSLLFTVFINSVYHQFPSGKYLISGYVYMEENPRFVLANQRVIVNNSDTLYTDSNGHFWMECHWVVEPFLFWPKQYYSKTCPEFLSFQLSDSVGYSILNDGIKYGFKAKDNPLKAINHVDLTLPMRQRSKGAKWIVIEPHQAF